MINRFEPCLTTFTWRPENDGQPCHNEKGDSGGVTSWGMTYGTFTDWMRSQKLPVPTVQAFAQLPRTAFIPCYQAMFWNGVFGDQLPVGLDLLAFDFSVMSNTVPAIRILQSFLNIKVDGILGPITRAAITQSAADISLDAFSEKIQAYHRTCKGFSEWGHGWLRRDADALTQAKLDQASAKISS